MRKWMETNAEKIKALSLQNNNNNKNLNDRW